MAIETVKLGAFIAEIIKTINNNFADIAINKANLSDIPEKVSTLENDSGYQTAEQVAQAVAALVNAAPETLNTLKELADALGNDPDFAATIAEQIGRKVDKEDGKGLSANDFTDALLEKLNTLKNYVLPIADDELGGVKNGGNVVVNPDGTMTAPSQSEGTAAAIQQTFITEDWAGPVGGVYTLTIDAAGKHPLSVWRRENGKTGLSLCDMQVSGLNVLVESYDKFAGYLLLL